MTFGCFKKHGRLTMFHLNIAHKNVKRVKCREFLFKKEGSKAAARLQDDSYQLVMELVPGMDLFTMLKAEGAFPPDTALLVGQQPGDRVILRGVITGDSLRRETWTPNLLNGDEKHVGLFENRVYSQ